MVHEVGRERGGGGEAAGRDDHVVDEAGLDSGLAEERVHGGEHALLGLLDGVLQRGDLVGGEDERWRVGLVSQAGLEVDVAHELHALGGEVRGLAHEGLADLVGALAVGRGLVAGVVEEEDRAGAGEAAVEEVEEGAEGGGQGEGVGEEVAVGVG